jgi:transposase
VIEVPAHTRRKIGRKPLPADLPRIEVVHDLSEEEQVCGCGCMMVRIGQDTSEQLDIVPARMQVIRHIRYKYACKACEGVESEGPTVKIAPVPEQIIPKSIATPGLLAHIFTAKFVDAVPFYRQEKQFERLGVELNRTSMSSWAIKVADQCGPLMEMLHSDILSGPLINMDETTVQVLGEQDRPNHTKSYMWVIRGGPPGKPGLVYQYHPTRSGEVAKKYLAGYCGYVQTDGYAGYDFLDGQQNVVHVGCWAHARRKFMEVIQAHGKDKKHKSGSADVAIGYIQKLYAIEKEARTLELGSEELYRLRQEKSKPILEEFKAWLDKKALQTPPKGLVGKSVAYTLGQWSRLIKYIDSGLLTPDNNLAENAIRPFVVGRKNWLFSGNPEGAQASANLYSLIETAKANGLEPYRYLRCLFERLPHAYTAEDYKALMPQHLDPAKLVVNF